MKTVYIVGGVLVGGVVVYELFLKTGAPLAHPISSTAPKVTSSGSILAGLASPLASIFAALGSSASKSGPAPIGSAAAGQSAFNGNTGIDASTGGVSLPEGQAYGPSLPVGFTPPSDATGGDNGLISPTEF